MKLIELADLKAIIKMDADYKTLQDAHKQQM